MTIIQKDEIHIARRCKFNFTPYVLLIPAVLFFSVFTYYPFLKTILLSFSLTNRSGQFTKWVGFSNWIRILAKEEFWNTVWVTLKFAAINLFFTFFLAMAFALISADMRRGSKIYQTMYALPMAVASAPAAGIWIFMFRQDGGLLNLILGTDFAWITSLGTAMASVAIVTIWMNVGASFIFLLVGFRNVPEELNESAIIDGASWLRRIISIKIPMASPQIFFVLFLNLTTSFKSFAQINLLTNGGPANSTTTLIYNVYRYAIILGRFYEGTVYAITLFAIIFLLTRIQFRLEDRMVHYQ